MAIIYSVENVAYVLEKSLPPNLVIDADGTVSSGGWSNFELSIVVHAVAPADGIQEFHFIGKEPDPNQVVSQGFVSGRKAHTRIDAIDLGNYWGPGQPLKGIRVTAKTNSKEVAIP